MLEPLHACNLTCTGCGRIREYETTIKEKLTRRGVPGLRGRGRRPDRQHLRRRADDLSRDRRAGPRHPQAPQAHLPLHQRHVHQEEAARVPADRRASSSTSTSTAWKRRTTWPSSATGVFKAAVEGIKAAKKAGFLVCTNTTIYKETDLDEIDALFAYLTKLGVDGFMLSPAYGYTAVQETNPDGAAEIFLTRDDIRAKFQEAEKLLDKYRMMSSPIYLEFLSGKRELTCTAWGNPTRNVKGWKGPCVRGSRACEFAVDGCSDPHVEAQPGQQREERYAGEPGLERVAGQGGRERRRGRCERARCAGDRHPLVGVLVDAPGGLDERSVVECGERRPQDGRGEHVGAVHDGGGDRGERGEREACCEHGDSWGRGSDPGVWSAERGERFDLLEELEVVELVPVLVEATVADPPDVDRVHLDLRAARRDAHECAGLAAAVGVAADDRCRRPR